MKGSIILIGYRGTGKTTIGELLAKKLKMKLVSLDRLIIEKAKMSIPELVEKYGWEHFRKLETDALKEVVKKTRTMILDCGGGVIEKDENINILKRAGIVFWLKATPETIESRIKNDTQRPSLTGSKSFVEEIKEVLERREPNYAKCSDFVIETDDRTPEEICESLISLYISYRK